MTIQELIDNPKLRKMQNLISLYEVDLLRSTVLFDPIKYSLKIRVLPDTEYPGTWLSNADVRLTPGVRTMIITAQLEKIFVKMGLDEGFLEIIVTQDFYSELQHLYAMMIELQK